jgi:hypothetical protein
MTLVTEFTGSHVRFNVITAVVVKNSIFWDIMPCSPLKINWHLGGTCNLLPASCCFLLGFLQPWRWRWHVPPKVCLTFNGLCSFMSQKTEFFTGSHGCKKCTNGFWKAIVSPILCSQSLWYSCFLSKCIRCLQSESSWYCSTYLTLIFCFSPLISCLLKFQLVFFTDRILNMFLWGTSSPLNFLLFSHTLSSKLTFHRRFIYDTLCCSEHLSMFNM